MLRDKSPAATVAVKDMAVAKRFYSETLGLEQIHAQGEGAVTYKAGNSSLFVYVSHYAGTNQATSVTWGVGDELDDIIETLKSKGVTFEHYDLPDMTREGDVHVAGTMRVAWFKDPDGNIHNLGNG